MQGQTGTEHVRQLLDELGARYTPTEDGKLKVEAGSTAIYMTVEEVGGHEVVCLLAPLLSDLAPTADQLAELLAFNAELNFGKFSWHPEERTLTLDYELLGDSPDRDELAAALEMVGTNADKLDEWLKPLLGGRLPHIDA